ncbi:hypothetical protein [Paenibacillus sacheonensis]|uniref:Uncharacterized protein n=1 Tax=Paenibacillus sacheonensis TaxID=742054 RepID=A0A7X4YKL6_9BACL|nr:hypothetical protein [Paenibacillus sacheonensis]MBM7563321.1 hypothetical protein [Paenibacillus sacheonensis]NBC68122.1 hypothetical protein [Paenibacillus sacheonensis]
MPIVLRHRDSGEIACGTLKNVYDFAYYGALWWEDNETAERQASESLALAGYENDGGWDLLEVKEERLKLFNVKLNNDGRRRLQLRPDGMIAVVKG